MRRALRDQWALVTGASSGLGAQLARTLAFRGANVVLVARREQRLLRLSETIEAEYGVLTRVLALDLTREGAAAELYRRVTSAGVEVEILVNNAGFGLYGQEIRIPWIRERAMLDLDIQTLVHLTKLFGRDMVTRGHGRVMQVSSVGAFQPLPTYAAYSAAKSFVQSYGEAVGFEWRKTGVSCTVLSPGVIGTEFLTISGQRPNRFQRGSMMTASDVARIGVAGMLRGRRVVVPGLANKLTVLLTRLIPRGLAAWLAARSMREDVFVGAERREHERLSRAVDCWLRFDGVELPGYTRDLSLGGVAIVPEVDTEADIGQPAVVGLSLPAGELEANCRVVRVGGSEIAIAFEQLDGTREHDLLVDWVKVAAPTRRAYRA